ncbi:hypothetical protein GQ44DRAFT_706182 [Phaeosphaeriaceae sp. PMI808]|nr:hypothetical protein GQ44DRAFT_706182 [Phaeosphaeriaceae sp. PMI808]
MAPTSQHSLQPTSKFPPTHSPKMDSHLRAVRIPPHASRRALFSTTRRQAPTSVVRPDTATIFQQNMDDELVERDDKGDFKVNAPNTTYKHLIMGTGRETDEETEQENQIIDLYGKQNPHWDPVAVEEEIRAALKGSLRKKVGSIEEDRWMFEGDREKK